MAVNHPVKEQEWNRQNTRTHFHCHLEGERVEEDERGWKRVEEDERGWKRMREGGRRSGWTRMREGGQWSASGAEKVRDDEEREWEGISPALLLPNAVPFEYATYAGGGGAT